MKYVKQHVKTKKTTFDEHTTYQEYPVSESSTLPAMGTLKVSGYFEVSELFAHHHFRCESNKLFNKKTN